MKINMLFLTSNILQHMMNSQCEVMKSKLNMNCDMGSRFHLMKHMSRQDKNLHKFSSTIRQERCK